MARLKKIKRDSIILLGILLLITVGLIYFSANQFNTITMTGDQDGVRIQKPSFTTINDCNSIFPGGECRTTSYTNRANGLTATAKPILHTRNQLYGKTPSYYENDGTPVYLGDIVIDYKCIGSEMRYRTGSETPYTCDDYGCDGSTRSLTQSVIIKAPANSIPAVMLQCYDYKITLGPDMSWVSAWAWVSTSYPSMDAKLVTSLPVNTNPPPTTPPVIPPPVVEPTNPELPMDPTPQPELTVWQKIIEWFQNLFRR